MRIVFIVLLSFLASACFAQSGEQKGKREEEDSPMPSSLDPSSSQKVYAPRRSRRNSSDKIKYNNPEEDFYNRMKDLQKTKRKNEKMMEKPQYSDPLYFGHKHPPKKHKPGKMKFCKVCGIRH